MRVVSIHIYGISMRHMRAKHGINQLPALCFSVRAGMPCFDPLHAFKRQICATTSKRPRTQPNALQREVDIQSLKNPRVKDARALLRRRQREKEGKILLEGQRLISDALHAGAVPHEFFYTRQALERGDAVQRLRNEVVNYGAEEFLVSDSVIRSFSDTTTPQGLVGVFYSPKLKLPRSSTLTLICDEVKDPGNLGTLIRSAAGAGVQAVLLTPGCTDVWSLKVLRSGMGAQFRLPMQYNMTWPDIIQYLNVSGSQIRVAEGTSDTLYTDVDWTVPSALVIGSEAEGPSEAALQTRHEKIAIPLASGVESLNAAMAGSVILFEAQRQKGL